MLEKYRSMGCQQMTHSRNAAVSAAVGACAANDTDRSSGVTQKRF